MGYENIAKKLIFFGLESWKIITIKKTNKNEHISQSAREIIQNKW
jgi:hypothetical protein